jgi:signal transduction histidine kinase
MKLEASTIQTVHFPDRLLNGREWQTMPVRKPNPNENNSRYLMKSLESTKKEAFPFPEKLLECGIMTSSSNNSREPGSQLGKYKDKFGLLVGYVNDLIGVIKNLEEQLQQNSNAGMVGKTMVAGLAHDLKNPLAVINSCAQLCLDNSELDESTKQYLHMIQENTEASTKLVNQFLAFAKVNLTFKSLNLNQLIKKAWQSAVLDSGDGQVSFKAHLAEDLPEILADPEKMERIFINLFLNAIQAVSQASSKGLITAQTKFRPEENSVEVLITDNGPGIPDEIRERIFTPFLTTKKEGTGLGLHLCSHFIHQHKGEIKIDQARGPGTKVLVKLPVTQERAHLTISDCLQEHKIPSSDR